MKVFLIAAISADGIIAETTDQLSDWTSSEDKKLFVTLTKEAGVMVFGSTTYATIGRPLPGRKTIVYTNHPENITDPVIETTNEAPEELVNRLAKAGVDGLAVCGGAQIYTLFAAAGVLDELYLTVEPICFGKGIHLFNGPLGLRLELLEARTLNSNAVLLHYRVLRS